MCDQDRMTLSAAAAAATGAPLFTQILPLLRFSHMSLDFLGAVVSAVAEEEVLACDWDRGKRKRKVSELIARPSTSI
jgi:hypothetical protein